jgi:hypothetical protein
MYIQLIFGIFLTLATPLWAAPKISESKRSHSLKKTEWMLGKFLSLSEKQPEKLLRISEKLLHADRVRMSTLDVKKAYEWQHRLAAVSALSDLFRKRPRGKTQPTYNQKVRARGLILKSLENDPSLLVRDGAAESVRRVIKFNRFEARKQKDWKNSLQKAFLSEDNHIGGEGLFIRETILTTLVELGEPLPKAIKLSAKRDKNKKIANLVRL